MSTIYTGQNIAKDCIVGDRLMNRYAMFNGLERPRRIDSNMNVQILGVAAPGAILNAFVATVAGGELTPDRWYAYVATYASSVHTRPIATNDGSGNYTRGNASPAHSVQTGATNNRGVVAVPGIAQAGIDTVFLYRSLGCGTEDEALAGPFFYVGQAPLAAGGVVFNDDLADTDVGEEVEADNFQPSSWRYACAAHSYVFAGGNTVLGGGRAVTATLGSSVVTLNGSAGFYDGILGWRFRLYNDTAGGVDGVGLYYANYVDGNTIQLTDAVGVPLVYAGTKAGTGQQFSLHIPGNLLRWSKFGEPEAWPTGNLIQFEGEIAGLCQIVNQPLLLVCTDTPSMYVLDLSLIGTDSFKTNKNLISTEHTVSSHFSLCPVEGKMRGIDASKGCIIEVDGTLVMDITSAYIPKIFSYLEKDANTRKLWHCAYDQRQKIFGAFVTFTGSQRMIDFCVGQHVVTGGWFFNFEKDLLCTGNYLDPDSGDAIILGGTEGPGLGRGGIWGRIWTPGIYDDWVPAGTLRGGTIASVQSGVAFTVTTGATSLATMGDGLIGRWVMVCDAQGEYAQVGYIGSNTANQIAVEGVINGLGGTVAFYPVPVAGWKFYLGLIEMRWGPKKFDFEDPDIPKKVWDIYCVTSGHNEDDPPFVRLYRGFEHGYDSQVVLSERTYLDRTKNQTLLNKTHAKMEPCPRWGMSWYDRSYDQTVLHSLTVAFNFVGKSVAEEQ